MTLWGRAAVVLAVVGVAFLALTGWLVADGLAAGAGAAALVPIALGVGLKGVLSLCGAAVMAYAARLEARRRALVVARRDEDARHVTAEELAPPLREAA